ncbi:MAG: hypothetical protein PWP51_2762 [Clostridiales bacterium]|jgi:NTP pyrophosphatase (non-canonical NTP hydrolase)|nr:hypothetical protein [Clostridiales bacterium]
MANSIDIKEALEMSQKLWEKHKETWWPMSPEHGKTFMLYMIEEMGEAIAIIKKKGDDAIMENPEVRARFIEEMCDMMMYYADVLNRYGISHEEYTAIYREKFHQNMVRDFKKDHEGS